MKFQMKSTVLGCLCLCLLFSAHSSTVYAAETPITKTEIFESETSEFSYPFKEEIAEDGRSYKLNHVDYSILSQKAETSITHETTSLTVNDLYEQSFDIADPSSLAGQETTQAIIIDGKTYKAELENISYNNIRIRNRTADVETTLRLTEEKITDTIEYEYDDIKGNGKVKVILNLKESDETEETETESTEFGVVFHRYDAGAFLINNRLVPLQTGGSPIAEEYYADLKAESVYSNSDGELTSLRWNGDEYILNGETCRNAIATLTDTKKIYAVIYSATVNLPDADGFQAVLTYGTDVEKPTGKVSYQVKATAEYNLVPEATNSVPPLLVGAGIAVFALLVAVVLAVIVKKKKKKPVVF